MDGNDVRNTRFARGYVAYSPRRVDRLLARVADELDAGRSAVPLIASAGLGGAPLLGGYSAYAVAAFLDLIGRQEADFERARLSAADPWRDLAAWNFPVHGQGDYWDGAVGSPRRPPLKEDRRRAEKAFTAECARVARL